MMSSSYTWDTMAAILAKLVAGEGNEPLEVTSATTTAFAAAAINITAHTSLCVYITFTCIQILRYRAKKMSVVEYRPRASLCI